MYRICTSRTTFVFNKQQASVIQRYPRDKHWQNQLSYPVDSTIHPLNNWGQECTYSNCIKYLKLRSVGKPLKIVN